MKRYTVEVLTSNDKVIERHETNNPLLMIEKIGRIYKSAGRLDDVRNGLKLTIWELNYYNDRTRGIGIWGCEAWRYINRWKEVKKMGYDMARWRIQEFVTETYGQTRNDKPIF
jgi:hypothetical protein